eukprot:6478974-Amphidinium_carterae.1
MLAATTSVDEERISTKLSMDPSGLTKKLHEVQALNACASKDSDRFAILFRIMNPAQKQRYESFESFQHRMEHPSSKITSVGHSSFTDFDYRVRQYLATPLFESAILNRELDAAIRYATHAELHVHDI